MTSPEYVVDFSALMFDLRRLGFSDVAIADAVHIPRTTAREYRNGSTPSFDVGERLIAFWCSNSNRKREDVPVTRVQLSAGRVSR